ncbi:MAG: T9SS type A sorting domain-containing protein [Bacteroidetes bacterium]|nr:T9SS type A sorting domain-containing protein [Bacteroidota bacterium]
MKKLLLVLFVCMIALTSRASHLMGGQMTSRNIGGLTYEVTVTAYRDTLGVPMYTTATFHYSDSSGAWSAVRTINLNGPVVFGNGVEEYSYVDTITFTAAGNYSMWYEDCCRNCAILNILNPCNYSFHLYNNLWADSTNSSPVFLNPPIPIAQIGTPFTYNPLPFDADGDSIAWALDTPVTSAGVYVPGYVVPLSDTSMPFAMDPVTGVVSFLPIAVGHYEVSVLVNEFRNGVQIGQIRRDMQIIVISSSNQRLQVSSVSNTSPNSGFVYDVNPNSPFTVTVTVLDPDFQSLDMFSRGEPFLLTNNPAQFSVINSAGVSEGTISWTPDVTQARTAPYILALRINEPFGLSTFSNDITLRLNVTNTVAGISTLKNEGVRNVYPNPNNGNFTVEINSNTSTKSDIVITNMIGQQVYLSKNIQLHEGLNAVVVNNASLLKGSYMISIVKDGKTTSVKSFEVAY